MFKTFVRTIFIAAMCVFGSASIAKADSLYFEKAQVNTRSEATCMQFAANVAHAQGFQNWHSTPAEFAGSVNGVYVSITCIGRGQLPAIAVVMAMAPNFGAAQQTGHMIADRMRGIQCMDSPC